jgi:hypothetical protein
VLSVSNVWVVAWIVVMNNSVELRRRRCGLRRTSQSSVTPWSIIETERESEGERREEYIFADETRHECQSFIIQYSFFINYYSNLSSPFVDGSHCAIMGTSLRSLYIGSE